MVVPTVPKFVPGEREMVLSDGVIKCYIINAHTPTGDRSGRYELISFILDNVHFSFLRNYLSRTDPITIRNLIDYSCIK